MLFSSKYSLISPLLPLLLLLLFSHLFPYNCSEVSHILPYPYPSKLTSGCFLPCLGQRCSEPWKILLTTCVSFICFYIMPCSSLPSQSSCSMCICVSFYAEKLCLARTRFLSTHIHHVLTISIHSIHTPSFIHT